ncbi:TetR/AcrR family transcriptional regulator [Gordonia westfalica]|uniref:TetR/AcrR family transcriptional regulator n=3 Tax=Gordonia TaxID=2053 RepID=A0AAW6RDK2_GORRU|nr:MULTISPECIES: TetR/AcrR family transcriptional regulator [Gordonia]MDG6783524.1 TetR/AcrR family transcriptional regulator [Gordonia rubripertincta]MDJ0010204.1 TetR/AcrR family transcriptional regulator [Gordonia alkanivorans]MDJ0099872.1 TetR/AcrR family transcriptional regulator [Gordonia alkanivorans]MDJ0495865.1 TetR/AcrR family transcriptional regulator [Gordonia alkanivorans]MDS1114276.1 TetR/AcrR family transcriptional regulator [Gordonia westfalica]
MDLHHRVRDIAARAGVGVGTVYRHFPTRADLVTAVYRHQVDECVALAETLNADDVPPTDALCRWTSAFTDFLVTKHGLSDALSSDDPSLNNLHALIFDSLVPAFASLVERAQDTGAVSKDVSAVTFLRAIGNLCIVGPGYTEADAKAMVGLLLGGSGASPGESLTNSSP